MVISFLWNFAASLVQLVPGRGIAVESVAMAVGIVAEAGARGTVVAGGGPLLAIGGVIETSLEMILTAMVGDVGILTHMVLLPLGCLTWASTACPHPEWVGLVLGGHLLNQEWGEAPPPCLDHVPLEEVFLNPLIPCLRVPVPHLLAQGGGSAHPLEGVLPPEGVTVEAPQMLEVMAGVSRR